MVGILLLFVCIAAGYLQPLWKRALLDIDDVWWFHVDEQKTANRLPGHVRQEIEEYIRQQIKLFLPPHITQVELTDVRLVPAETQVDDLVTGESRVEYRSYRCLIGIRCPAEYGVGVGQLLATVKRKWAPSQQDGYLSLESDFQMLEGD